MLGYLLRPDVREQIITGSPETYNPVLEFSSGTRESQASVFKGQRRAEDGLASSKVAVDPPSAAAAHVPRITVSFPNFVLPLSLRETPFPHFQPPRRSLCIRQWSFGVCCLTVPT